MPVFPPTAYGPFDAPRGVWLGLGLLAAAGLASCLWRRKFAGAAILGAAAAACFAAGALAPTPPPAGEPGPAFRVVWAFEPPGRGAFVAAPLVAGDRVYAAATHDALAAYGTLYCLDRRTGAAVWKFDDGGSMKQTISSPCLAGGRLYFGEGMHGNLVCKFRCVDAATGRKLWDFEADGHIESSPCAAGGAVFFGAGDDGVYCLDAATGKPRWHSPGPPHVDAGPAVAGGRLFSGGGVSLRYKETAAFCLRADDGGRVWRVPTDLPVWAAPAADGADVFVGLGNGRLNAGAEPPEVPRGALLCLDAATGRQRWRYDVPDGVLARAAADARCVYFGSRDGCCYCLDRVDGRPRWKRPLGGPVVAAPALAGGRLYVAPEEGPLYCLDAEGGETLWAFDLARHTQTRPRLFAAPVVMPGGDAGEGGRRIYVAAELRNPVRSAAALYCLED